MKISEGGKGSYEKGGEEKSGAGEGEKGVVWETSTGNPRMLCFWVDRESKNVGVALLFSRRGSEPHRGEGIGGGVIDSRGKKKNVAKWWKSDIRENFVPRKFHALQ